MFKRGKYTYSYCRKFNYFLILLLLFPLLSFSQTDTTKKDMSFDFGLTRDKNINLWPIYKRTISDFEKDKQLLFPIYRNYQNTRIGERRSHILPIYWKDSSKSEENLRVISTYYPSIHHLTTSAEEKTKTFTFLEFAPRINLLEFKKSPDGLIMQNNLLFFLWFKNNQITKKSYFVVFPAYWQFKTSVKESKTLIPLFSYGCNTQGKSHYHAITPLFWHFDSPKRSSNLLLPIWWNRKMVIGKDSIKSNFIIPIYFSHKDKYKNNKILFPVVWSLNNSRYKSLTIAPLLSIGKSHDDYRSHQMITPFLWHIKNDELERRILFPIVWSTTWKTRYEYNSSLVVFPLYWAQQNNDERTQTLLPFIWSKNSKYYNSFSFIPLLSFGQSSDNSFGHLMVTPLFWHFRTATGYSNTLIPLWWYRKKGEGEDARINNVIFPFYWAWQDDSYKGNILFPLIWNFQNPDYHSFTFAPLFTIRKSTDNMKSLMAVSPLYWRFKTEEGKGQLLFPLWLQNDRTLQGELKSSSKVVTFYWKYSDKERNHTGFFPLIWKFSTPTRKSFTFFPIISSTKNINEQKGYIAVTPIFWHFTNSNKSFNTLFPIWWNRNVYEANNTKHFNLIVPLYFSKWDSIRSNRVLFPIIWSLRNPRYNSFTFVPLFSYGSTSDNEIKHLTITPLFWYLRNPDGYSTTFLPLFWHSAYGEGGSATKWSVLFPIYWANVDEYRNNHVVFPVVWSFDNPNYTSLTVAPLFSFGHNDDNSKKHLAITPLFYFIKNQTSTSRVLFPIWWSFRNEIKKNTYKTDVVFPIYWALNNKQQTTKVVFPLVWSFKSKKSQSFTFVPLFSSGQNVNGNKYKMITPLFWKFDSNIRHRRVLFPLFTSYNDTSGNKQFDLLFFLFRKSRTSNSTSTSILWPFIERSKSPDYSYFRFAPIVWSKNSPTFSYFTIQPLYYHSISNNQSTDRILWELYVHRNQFEVKKTNRILWEVATWDRYTNGDREFRLLYLLYSNSNIDGRIEKSIFPLYYFTKENNGNRSLSVFLYFYNSLKRKIPNTKEYYQEERIFWLIRIRSNYKILKQKGIDVD